MCAMCYLISVTEEIATTEASSATPAPAATSEAPGESTAPAATSTWTSWYNSYDPYRTEDTEGDFEQRLELDPVRWHNIALALSDLTQQLCCSN